MPSEPRGGVNRLNIIKFQLQSQFEIFFYLTLYASHKLKIPGRVMQAVACLTTDVYLTADQVVASSILAPSHAFVEIDHEIMCKIILLISKE